MEQPQTYNFSDTLRQAGFARALKQQKPPEALVIRELSSDGAFLRSVKCLPGQITVLRTAVSGVDPFGQALTARPGASSVVVRYGKRELHYSEVYVAGSACYLCAAQSLGDVLLQAGIPPSFHALLLAEIGLAGRLHDTVLDLHQGLLRRLAVICAYFTRSRVLLFENPFLHVDSRWTAVLAKLMLEGAETGQQIVVVTGLDKIPAVWKSHPQVALEGRPTNCPAADDALLSGDPLAQIRSLRAENPGAEARFFVTKPQMVHPARIVAGEAIQAEAICNPYVEGLGKERQDNSTPATGQGAAAEAGQAQEGAGAGRKRKATGKLTRVTRACRLKQSRLLAAFLRGWLGAERLILRPRPRAALPPAVTLEQARRRRTLKLMLLVLLGLILFQLLMR